MGLESIDLLPIGLVASSVMLALSGLTRGGLERALRTFGIGAFLLALAALSWNLKHTVRPGTVGVQVLHGTTENAPLRPGQHFVHPHAHFHEMVTRRQTLDFTGAMAFRQVDPAGNPVHLEVSVPFKLRDTAAPYIYEYVGPDDVYIPQLKQTTRAAITRIMTSTSISGSSPKAVDNLAAKIEGSVRIRVAEGLMTAGFSQPQALSAIEFGRPEILKTCQGACDPAPKP